ncbi:MAG TPA: sigma-70 family RNA polymerase sigma factor [Opitutaceae bacterium]|nr:sigma-70 family RNA polymerase sigma factor [Opitutaceae bacterium]
MQSRSSLEIKYADWLREHRGILLKIAASFGREREEQADLFQEMSIALWRSLPAFKAQSKTSTWIYRVCLNTALAWRRAETKPRGHHAPLELIPELSSDAPPPGNAHERDEILQRLYAAVRALPPSERSLVILLLDGLSYREMGEISGLTENHVGVALTRARKKLAEAMKEVGNEL